jgi:hypothetical protein
VPVKPSKIQQPAAWLLTRQQLNNLKEDIGTKLIPAFTGLLKIFSQVLDGAALMGRDLGFLWDKLFNPKQFQATVAAEKQAQIEKNIEQAAQNYTRTALKAIDEKKFTLKQITDNLESLLANPNINERQKQIDALSLQLIKEATSKQKLGVNGGDDDSKKKTKDAIDDLKKLIEELKKIQLDTSFDGLQEQQRQYQLELALLKEKYEEFTKRAKGNKQALLLIEQDYQAELQRVQDKHIKSELERLDKLDAAQRKHEQERLVAQAKLAVAALPQAAASIGTALSNDVKFRNELALLKLHGQARFQEQLRQLEAEHQQELRIHGTTVDAKAKIDADYQKKREALELTELQKHVEQVKQFVSAALDIYSIFADAKTQQENAELARDQKVNDRKKQNLERGLKSGLVSQLEYDRQVADIERKQEARQKEIQLKQFQRNQKMQIAQAIMNGAFAVTKILAETPKFDFGVATAIEIGLAIATTAAQVAKIATQKPGFAKGGLLDEEPKRKRRFAKGGRLEDEHEDLKKFASGGFLRGPSHAEGGIQLYTKNGYHFGEAEGGEAIINKRSMSDRKVYTLTGTPSQIASNINAMHGGVKWEAGGVLKPQWATAKPKPFNYPVINNSITQVRTYYASGGIIGGGKAAGAASENKPDDGVNQELLAMLLTMQHTLTGLQQSNEALQTQLQNPIKAYSVITEQEVQQQRLDNIRKDATMK